MRYCDILNLHHDSFNHIRGSVEALEYISILAEGQRAYRVPGGIDQELRPSDQLNILVKNRSGASRLYKLRESLRVLRRC